MSSDHFIIDPKDTEYEDVTLTVEEQEQKHKDWCEQNKKDNMERYEKNKSKYKEDYEGLPLLLKNRMDHLYKENPDDRFDWEGYEMFIMTQATLIYDTLKTKEKVEEFKLAEYDIQKEMVPELSDGHSGNTFGGACFYASCLADIKQESLTQTGGKESE